MVKISLTDFVDFVISSGSPKLAKVSEIKGRAEYQPAFDFWKPLRDGIVGFHKDSSQTKSTLDKITTSINDPKKIARYPDSIQAYKRFLGRKDVSWFDPPYAEWNASSLGVRINPELGLDIKGDKCVIKLYFKSDRLSKRRIEIILLLLQSSLGNKVNSNVQFGVLDIQRSKLFKTSSADPSLLPLLQGEALSFVTIWNNI